MLLEVLAVFLLLWVSVSFILIIFLKKEKPLERLKYFDGEKKNEGKEDDNKKNLSLLKKLSSLVPKFKFNRNIESELVKADLPITAEELLVIKLLSASSLAFLAFAVSKDYFIVIVFFTLIWNIPRFIISKKKKDRIKLFDSQLSEGINIISNSLKAGYSFLQSVAVVSRETRAPFSKEFEKLLKEMSLGIPEEDALKNLLNRVDSDDLRLMINAILIQKDIGGNLSEVLDNISSTIQERQKIKNELRTLTAQGRLSGIILTLMPVFLGMIIYLFNKEYIMLLFTTTLGIAMVVMAVISELFGMIMIRKIIDIDM